MKSHLIRRTATLAAAISSITLFGAEVSAAKRQQGEGEPKAGASAPTSTPAPTPPNTGSAGSGAGGAAGNDDTTFTTEPRPEPAPKAQVVAPAPDKASETAATTPVPETPQFELKPYVLVAGGLKVDNVIDKKGEDRDDRFVTFAVSRFGLNGRWGKVVTVQSELMASGGIGLHGTSAYEGQAALQVRQQLVRVSYAPVVVEVGRILDEASVDYISAHVQDTLAQDTAIRDPLLYSGYNLGNGIRGTVELVPKLRFGVTLNAGNPVSTTSTLAVGGTYPPFERIYTQAYQAVNQGANHFPDDTFHAVVITPSVIYEHEYFDLRVAGQRFDISTDTTKGGDDHVRGYNIRGTARAKLLHKMIVPFASGAYTRNDTLVTNKLDERSPDRYQAVNLGGGIDLNLARRHAGFEESADGIGVQYQNVQFQVGDGLVTTLRYANVGGTYWLTPHVAVGARAALWVQQQKGAEDFGERTFTVGLRAVIP